MRNAARREVELVLDIGLFHDRDTDGYRTQDAEAEALPDCLEGGTKYRMFRLAPLLSACGKGRLCLSFHDNHIPRFFWFTRLGRWRNLYPPEDTRNHKEQSKRPDPLVWIGPRWNQGDYPSHQGPGTTTENVASLVTPN